jgi:AbiV family abortive infection protein
MASSAATKRKIAGQYFGPLNESQIAEAIAGVHANVCELVSAAEVLIHARIYSKSCALSILAIEESQKVAFLLDLLYADTPDEQRQIWKDFRNHKKKHVNIGIHVAASAIVEGTIAPDPAAATLKMKDAPDPDILEELRQALIYCDCIVGDNGLPQWACPAGSVEAEASSARLLESARGAAEQMHLFSEEELRVYKRFMAPVRKRPWNEQLEQLKKCWTELERLGFLKPPRAKP